MPSRLANPPANFQALMNDILKPLLCKFVLVFFDDILVYRRLRVVFQVLRQNKLVANKKKCSFRVEQVWYLSHIVSGNGVSADSQKIEAMLNWPQPKDVKGLRGFVGLTGYYQRFVKGYGAMVKP